MSNNPFERPAATATATAAPSAAPVNGGLGSVGVQGSDDPYSISTPSGVSGVRMSDPGLIDQLLLVEPVEYLPSMTTSASKEPVDAFRVNILPLTGELAGELQPDVLIFQEALKRELRKTYAGPNRWLLAYHHLGDAKPGKNAPYLFTPPNEEQMALFEKFKAQRAATAGTR